MTVEDAHAEACRRLEGAEAQQGGLSASIRRLAGEAPVQAAVVEAVQDSADQHDQRSTLLDGQGVGSS